MAKKIVPQEPCIFCMASPCACKASPAPKVPKESPNDGASQRSTGDVPRSG
jgi:hypothetical protein